VPRNIFRKCGTCIEGGWQRFPVVVSTSDTLGSVTDGLALLALVHSIDNKVILSFIQNTVRLLVPDDSYPLLYYFEAGSHS
jgi:hypothetical protein